MLCGGVTSFLLFEPEPAGAGCVISLCKGAVSRFCGTEFALVDLPRRVKREIVLGGDPALVSIWLNGLLSRCGRSGPDIAVGECGAGGVWLGDWLGVWFWLFADPKKECRFAVGGVAGALSEL